MAEFFLPAPIPSALARVIVFEPPFHLMGEPPF
jgi:hypothetical protein